MKISKEEACKIAQDFALKSFKGSLELRGARLVEAPTGLWGTSGGQTHGEWRVIFRKVPNDGIVFEPDIMVIIVDAVTGETAKFPMI
jgi:hypothetical protein